MSEVTFRKWYLGDFGYGYHGCIDVDGEELYETFDENIAVKLYNFLKKRDNISLSDIKEFFHFLWIESECGFLLLVLVFKRICRLSMYYMVDVYKKNKCLF